MLVATLVALAVVVMDPCGVAAVAVEVDVGIDSPGASVSSVFSWRLG